FPEPIVAASPHEPRVAPLNLFARQRDRTVPVLIHVVEIIPVGGLERGGVATRRRRERFVENVPGPAVDVPQPARRDGQYQDPGVSQNGDSAIVSIHDLILSIRASSRDTVY